MKGIGKTVRRRRHEAKTDYKSRLSLLTSRKNRLVIRRTNRYIIIQLVSSEKAQDKVICSANSQELLSKGWPAELKGSLKSRPAAYLTGLLLGKKLKGKAEAVLDIGMQRNVSKSRLYSALKGVIDSGINVPASKEILPTMEELKKNAKTSDLLEKMINKIGDSK